MPLLKGYAKMEKKHAVQEVVAIREKINKLVELRDSIVSKKRPIEAELAKMTAKVKASNSYMTRLSPAEYRHVQLTRAKLVNKLTYIDKQLTPIKSELRQLHLEEDMIRAACADEMKFDDRPEKLVVVDHTTRIKLIRDKWQNFASDPTRIASMRLMASHIVDDLTSILDVESIGEQ